MKIIVLNIMAVVLTMLSITMISRKGDDMIGWCLYVTASITGVIYFALAGDWIQVVLWGYLGCNGANAIRRKIRYRVAE